MAVSPAKFAPPDLLPVRRALISVFDKTGIVDFARALRARGVEIVSTGGTRAALDEAGIAVTDLAETTGFPEIMEALVIGQDWDNDVRIVLFVRMQPGQQLTEELMDRIRKTIRANASPYHVPKKIIEVADIPRTISGKITELAVRNIVHGRPVKNADALANPEALELYRDLAELQN